MRRFLVSASLGFLVLFMLACIGIAVPLDLAVAVVFGWIIFLIRVLPKVRINGWGVATAFACLVSVVRTSCYVDGSVHFIKNTVAPNVLKALSTPKGGELISSEQY